MTRPEIIKLLETMAAVYPNTKELKDPERMVDAWCLAFGDDDAQTILKAATLHMKTCRFFPTIADIQKSIPRALLMYGSAEQQPPRIPSAPNKKIDPYRATGCDVCPVRESGACKMTPKEIEMCNL